MPEIKFIYFDLGNVILPFDHRRGARQMAEVAGVPPELVWETVFTTDLMERFDRGTVSARGFYDEFCEQSRSRPDFAQFQRACGDIFTLNTALLPVVTQLTAAGYPLGILSNTCSSHWEFAVRRFCGILTQGFAAYALSYEIGAVKPEPAIYAAAAKLAGAQPAEIFYCDDIAGHVAGAQKARFHAVLYEDPPRLIAALLAAGVRFNH